MTGPELRAIRDEVGWTQARLATYLGMNRNYVAQMERGTVPITERTARAAQVLVLIHRLAQAMGLLDR